MKVLILGGYGVFGGRLAQLLSDVSSLELVIAGRSKVKAEAFCQAYVGAAKVRPLQLDRAAIRLALADERPDLVVDASGPFQQYGEHPYRVIEACIEARIDYLDFADAADFVFGVAEFDAAARAAGVFVISGVSSFPVLTAAVLRQMARTMDIVSVDGGIAPSPHAGIGLNVMRAVVGYAGAPVKLMRNGAPSYGIGLAESRRFTIAAPGRVPLRNIHFSLVDVPDLQVLPPEHPTLRDIWMGAGPVPESLHRVLNLLAKARALLKLPSWAPFSPLFFRVLNLMKFGEHRGGMFVRAEGVSDGRKVEQTWHLLAEGDDGPFIPSMAIEGIVRKLLAGEKPQPGARAGIHALELSDYDKLFAGRAIHTGFRTAEAQDASLYRRILGSAFDALPEPLQALHDAPGTRRWIGQADVTRGKGLLARLLGALMGFPRAGCDVPVEVVFAPEGNGERWIRTFAGRAFSSFQWEGAGKNDYLLLERFGAVSVAMALKVEHDRLSLVPRRWFFLGVAMPQFLLPRGHGFEHVQGDRFAFDVAIVVPVAGLVVAYKGTLRPA